MEYCMSCGLYPDDGGFIRLWHNIGDKKQHYSIYYDSNGVVIPDISEDGYQGKTVAEYKNLSEETMRDVRSEFE